MKVRKVIGSGVLSRGCIANLRLVCNWKAVGNEPDYPPGLDVEITALVEPERKLVRPEGAEWLEDEHSAVESRMLLVGKKLVTAVRFTIDGCWTATTKTHLSKHDSFEAAQQAAEEALADKKLYGFGWEEEPEVEYESYLVRWWTDGCLGNHQFPELDDAQKYFNNKVDNEWRVNLYGIPKMEDFTLLDHFDPEEENDGD